MQDGDVGADPVPDLFRALCDLVRVEAGQGPDPTQSEAEHAVRHRRRIVALKMINATMKIAHADIREYETKKWVRFL